MRYISNVAAIAALASFATAGDAPVAEISGDIGTTYSATIAAGVDTLSGAVKGSASPDGSGTNFQIAFYNLPGSGNLSYGLHTDRISNNDCNTAGAVLDPYAGTTGAKCSSNPASCQVGDLSDKHGDATILSGGSGTGYYSANFVDPYVSMDPSDEAFFGKGSFVVTDENGAAVACANFINASKVKSNSTSGMTSSSSAPNPTGNSQNSQTSSTSSGLAVRTAAPVIGAGVLGLAAMLL